VLLLPKTGVKLIRELHLQVMEGSLIGDELEAALDAARKEHEHVKDGSRSEAKEKLDDMEKKKKHVDVVYSIACMDANQRAVELKGYTDKEVQKEIAEEVREMREKLKKDGTNTPEGQTKNESKSKNDSKDGGGDDDEDDQDSPPPLGRCACLQICFYRCCLRCPGCSKAFEHYGVRAALYTVFSGPLFAYSTTLVPGVMLLVTGVIYVFAWWRGEAMPKLQNPYGPLSSQTEDGGDEEEEEEEDIEVALEPQVPDKDTRRRGKKKH